ncbi:5-(carboxyamino)imidazole ribonucleotide synthase [Corynebacterium ulceribovis]|uniref:5-(carboxyamino)imidazole ribonucleotide synthase n=1 Tax=Corynebacterium ulceribovis TaxID=487732 RepID=UPI00247FC4D7|nr:5-(carboxyamino)imidazole ribonucleotide synthase [Corynebacterium ulceribovis]
MEGVNSTPDTAAADNSQDSSRPHAPGMPVVTVIGDGQLARMMQTAAIELGQSLRLLAGSTDSSAAQVIADIVIGDYTNLDDLRRVTEGAVAMTFDHEHVPTEHLRALSAEGLSVQPGPDALIHAQDKLIMRQRLAEAGVPVPEFTEINSVADAEAFAAEVGEVCLKARRGGYDGHGVWFPSESELAPLVEKLLADDVPLMAERKMNLVRELSAMSARTPSGQAAAWPVVESVQRDGICVEAVQPAPNLSAELAAEAQELSLRVARGLNVTGVLAVELFEVLDDEGKPAIFVNELAMRPHNTGHWTQDGCVTSQFEQHLRAVVDYPLGSVAPTAPVTVMANILGGETDPEMAVPERFAQVWKRFPEAKIHWYGKGWRAGRKIGHVNLCGADGSAAGIERTRREAALAANFVVNAVWADGWRGEDTDGVADGEK